MAWLLEEAERDWLAEEAQRLLAFGARSRHPDGGFGWLDSEGQIAEERPVQLWITARMTHCFALGELIGDPSSPALVEHGLASLSGRFQDRDHGGWYAACDRDGPSIRVKETYGHSFVVLAASSALVAGHASAAPLLEDALDCFEQRLWSEEHGMVVDAWDEGFTALDPYRGLNANMHTVEAFLAASDATGDPRWRERALRITSRVLREYAPQWQWRLPEHFDTSWRPLSEYNRDRAADPFRPYGATVGHGLEWARLATNLEDSGGSCDDWLADGAARLFDRAVADGWTVDGAPGFVYTTDWEGRPVVRQRMHWVVAEGTAAAAALGRRTGEPRFATAYRLWWEHIREHFVDRAHGSWHHELDSHLRPSATVWEGKPDIYHALQATLVPRLPSTGSIAAALRREQEGQKTV